MKYKLSLCDCGAAIYWELVLTFNFGDLDMAMSKKVLFQINENKELYNLRGIDRDKRSGLFFQVGQQHRRQAENAAVAIYSYYIFNMLAQISAELSQLDVKLGTFFTIKK